ncbi:sugar ABC transporter permease [Anaerocolumna sp. AGMB13025]|uniref:carbohydrate ABC transporter permease n=1 Tax=Anaerocolumna sp. AGMB13025 TaxID=3039116 RepID=UPI00241C3A4C|nr:sugar ABC transporter permease [Anaerocolumna sp. AGMB13025]WFR57602.1 sugar ABC transporter permease [Anaerocolumna sp. AGMB13025]
MKHSKIAKRGHKAYIYILPWLIGLVVLQLYPFIASLLYSFTNYNAFGKMNFIGFDNYVRLFTKDKEFYKSLGVTIKYTLLTVPGKIILSLAIAVMLNKTRKGIGVLRTIFYLPSLFGGSIAVALLWKLLFMDNGLMNSLLHIFKLGPVSWLGDPKVALTTLSSLEIWQFGSSMVMFLAALKQVPQSLYEAAGIDGANKVQSFFKVTFPQITPILFFTIIMQTINALQNFTSAFVITKGGPVKSTYMLGLKLYNDGFAYYKMGYASASSWVIFILILAVTLVLFGTQRFWVFYEDDVK